MACPPLQGRRFLWVRVESARLTYLGGHLFLFSPTTLAFVPFLLWATLAHAQAAPVREPRRRSVTLADEPLEVRIAAGVRTFLVFSVPIQGRAVEVDRARIHVVDTGERSIIIAPLSEPRPDERWMLRVPLMDGKTPKAAELALVAHPSEVDTEIDIALPEVPDTPCQASCTRCAAMDAADAIAAGLIQGDGVRTKKVRGFTDAKGGFELKDGVSYRTKTWVLVDVQIIPPSGSPAWRPTGATLTSKTGEARVRAVKLEPGMEPSVVRVLVTTAPPPTSAGLEFTLHLNGADGAPSLSIPAVTLPPATEEPKP